MRENKFRAWDKFTGRFFYFMDGRYYNSMDLNHCISERICSEFPWADSDQFTGLHDKNGKEIYAGDIVKTPILFGDTGKIIFDEFSFIIEGKNNYAALDSRCEIIGNIHENPELLK